MNIETLGRWLLGMGLVLAALGGLLLLTGKVPLLLHLGSLPGDIRYQTADGRFGCVFPLVSMLLLSAILTVVLNVVVRLINR